VKRRVAFRLKFKQPHGKIRSTIILLDQPPHLDALSTLFLHALKLDFRVMNAFEAHFIPKPQPHECPDQPFKLLPQESELPYKAIGNSEILVVSLPMVKKV
jgi:hypothetical protein